VHGSGKPWDEMFILEEVSEPGFDLASELEGYIVVHVGTGS
jgi:hypothetical protein